MTAPNTGRISIVDRSGNRRTLLGRTSIGNQRCRQPFRSFRSLYARSHRLRRHGHGRCRAARSVSGVGYTESRLASSPIFSSIGASNSAPLPRRGRPGLHRRQPISRLWLYGRTLTLSSGGGKIITIRMVANFPDYIPFPLRVFQTTCSFQIRLTSSGWKTRFT